MAYQPRYRISQTVLRAAEELGAARAVVELLPLSVVQERELRRRASIRVTHDNLDVAPDEDWMRRLHACIMRGRGPGRPRERSDYRRTTVQVGNFTYIPPAWEDVPGLMEELSEWAVPTIGKLPHYLFAAILAYQFVTIHPFEDGNGRTCRALATWAHRRHYDPKGLLSVEEFYVRDLEGYITTRCKWACTSVTTMRMNAAAARIRISRLGSTTSAVAWPQRPSRCAGK